MNSRSGSGCLAQSTVGGLEFVSEREDNREAVGYICQDNSGEERAPDAYNPYLGMLTEQLEKKHFCRKASHAGHCGVRLAQSALDNET